VTVSAGLGDSTRYLMRVSGRSTGGYTLELSGGCRVRCRGREIILATRISHDTGKNRSHIDLQTRRDEHPGIGDNWRPTLLKTVSDG